MTTDTPTYCIDESALRDVLDDMRKESGSQVTLAAELQISTPYLNDLLQGRRPIAALAGRLGYRPLTVFVREDAEPGVTPAIAALVIESVAARIAKGDVQ